MLVELIDEFSLVDIPYKDFAHAILVATKGDKTYCYILDRNCKLIQQIIKHEARKENLS